VRDKGVRDKGVRDRLKDADGLLVPCMCTPDRPTVLLTLLTNCAFADTHLRITNRTCRCHRARLV
jgi:hypothetical protein